MHLIQKQQIEITAANQQLAREAQQAIEDLYWSRLAVRMDEVFTHFADEETTIALDSLTLDVGSISLAGFEAAVLSALKEKLADIRAKHTAKQSPPSEDAAKDSSIVIANPAWEAFVFFLRTGIFPWWFSVEALPFSDVLNRVLEQHHQALFSMLQASNETIQARLASQLELDDLLNIAKKQDAQWWSSFTAWVAQNKSKNDTNASPHSTALKQLIVQFIVRKAKEKATALSALVRELRQKAKSLGLEVQTIDAFFAAGLAAKETSKETENPITKADDAAIASMKALKQESMSETSEQTIESGVVINNREELVKDDTVGASMKALEQESISEASEQTLESGVVINNREELMKDDAVRATTKDIAQALSKGIYLKNIGWILVAPFLPTYFERLALLAEEKQNFRSAATQARAVLLTQYLATGSTTMLEYELLLNKIICGYPLEDTLENSITLTEQEIEQTEELLNAVIAYWDALGNSSIAALRETFFERAGKLTLTESKWELIVERRSLDILMDKIPWSFTMIQLPWMEKWLKIEW